MFRCQQVQASLKNKWTVLVLPLLSICESCKHFTTMAVKYFLRRVVACRQGTLTQPDTWSCPIWDLQMFFCWDHWHSIIHYTSLCLTWLLPTLTLLPNTCFHRASATGVACRQGTLTPPDTWSRPIGTCICSTCWDQSFSELVVILPDYALRISLGTFSILLFFCFCYLYIYLLSLSWAFIADALAKEETRIPSKHVVSMDPWKSTEVLYCLCRSNSVSTLWYLTFWIF